LTDELPPAFRIGLIAFSDVADQPVAPTTDHSAVKAGLDQLQPGGGTAIGDALQRALVSARTPVPTANGGPRRVPSVIVLLSDGKNNEGSADPLVVAREARRDRIPIDTIALGSPGGVVQLRDSFGFLQRVAVPPDPAGLRRIAELAGGRAFTAAQAG